LYLSSHLPYTTLFRSVGEQEVLDRVALARSTTAPVLGGECVHARGVVFGPLAPLLLGQGGHAGRGVGPGSHHGAQGTHARWPVRSEEHTSELQVTFRP